MEEDELEIIPCVVQSAMTVTLPQGFKVDLQGNKSVGVVPGLQRFLCVDVTFDTALTTIDYITFSNHYCNSVTIKWTSSDSMAADPSSWNTCLLDFKLMRNCHCEQGAQDNVVLGPDELRSVLRNVKHLRLTLKQPSFHWKEYNVYDLVFYSLKH